MNAWKILGIQPTESKKEIRKAYALCVKECHPEENPEAFEILNNAYKMALEYAENRPVYFERKPETDMHIKETDIYGDIGTQTSDLPQKMLLKKLEESEKTALEDTISTGIMKDITELYENEKLSKKQSEWEKLFLSDEFLKEQYSDEFLASLYYYLNKKTDGFKIPLIQSFIVELVIAYGIVADTVTLKEQGKFPGQKKVAEIWNLQSEEWREQRGIRILKRPDNIVRVRAVYNYQNLFFGNRKGRLKAGNLWEWHEHLERGKHTYIYELLNGKFFETSNSRNLIKLLEYWFRNEEIDRQVVEIFYDEYNLKSIEGTSYKSYYTELKRIIIEKYPDIEKVIYKEVIERDNAREITLKLQGICDRYLRNVSKLSEAGEEMLKTNSELEKLLGSKAWEESSADLVVKKWLIEVYTLTQNPTDIPEYLSYRLCEYYSDERFASDMFVQKMLMVISRHIIRIDKRRNQKKYIYWEYFMTYGFGLRHMEINLPDNKMFKGVWLEPFIKGEMLFLPGYMEYVYSSEREKHRWFLNLDENSEKIENPRVYEFEYAGNNKLRMEFMYHYVVYYYNDREVKDWKMSYDEFKRLVKNTGEMTAEAFFALLAITYIGSNNREDAEMLIRKWLEKTELLKQTFSIITGCIVMDNAPQMYSKDVYIAENGEMCLVLNVNENGFKIFRYTTAGMIQRSPRMGLNYENMNPYEILKAHFRPKPKKIAGFDVKDLTNEEKAQKIIEGMYINERFRRGENVMDIEHSYVLLKRRQAEDYYTYKLFSLSQAGRGYNYKAVSDYVWSHVEIEREELDKALIKNRVQGEITYYIVTEEDRPEGATMIAKNEEGRFFVRRFLSGGKLKEADTLSGLLTQMYEFDNVVEVDVYEGRTSLSRITLKPEYCFTQQDYKEWVENSVMNDKTKKVESLAEYYTIF